jgi:hypothetical protein
MRPIFSNNRFYYDYSYEDECSSYDPGAHWVYGSDYWECRYTCRIPKRIATKPDLIAEFIHRHFEDDDFFVDN